MFIFIFFLSWIYKQIIYSIFFSTKKAHKSKFVGPDLKDFTSIRLLCFFFRVFNPVFNVCLLACFFVCLLYLLSVIFLNYLYFFICLFVFVFVYLYFYDVFFFLPLCFLVFFLFSFFFFATGSFRLVFVLFCFVFILFCFVFYFCFVIFLSLPCRLRVCNLHMKFTFLKSIKKKSHKLNQLFNIYFYNKTHHIQYKY